ncbi:DUF6273 domain-containing protein [Lysinibacillus sp. 1 U-2021]|uniref:DUF6273 domain-containing protein n=1 Tax=Lysinibacillus sp. 1 U-2021 TaxID=3039426 RepID=UPI00248076BF|nr:DUF6273 domain-containing protein [Lysinibacillus sp. 1 U-2021]WGT37116.1 DUF6273 domain-containing protein [Lysinibacillus sp. 1 U-2021]
MNVQRIKDLPIGAKIKMGKFQSHRKDYPMIWRIISTDHHTLDPNYPLNAITLITDKVINTMTYDAKEPDNANEARSKVGNNRYRLSNVRQWLNSTLGDGHWYEPQNIIGAYHYNDRDTPPSAEFIKSEWRHEPYDNLNGFSTMFRDYELNSILPTKIKVGVNETYDFAPTVDGLERYDLLDDKFFLPSVTELGYGENQYNTPDGKGIAEGVSIPYFELEENRKSAMVEDCFTNSKYNNVQSNYTHDALIYSYMTRSSRLDSPIQFHLSSGKLEVAGSPYSVYCLRPMCNINGETLISLNPDDEGFYTIVADVPPIVEVKKVDVLDVHFDVRDMHGKPVSVETYFNGTLLDTFTSNLNETLVTTIPFDSVKPLQNELIFITKDDGNLQGHQTFKLDIKTDLVKVGDKVSGHNETFDVADINNNNDGTVTLIVDRNLKYRIEGNKNIELLTFNYQPKVHFTENYHSTPLYQDMKFKSMSTNLDGTVRESWVFEGDGVYSKTKVDIKRKSAHDEIVLKSIAQNYKFKDEM